MFNYLCFKSTKIYEIIFFIMNGLSKIRQDSLYNGIILFSEKIIEMKNLGTLSIFNIIQRKRNYQIYFLEVI